MGKPVVMGRKTLESMKSPLPGRTNIVLTRDPDWQRERARGRRLSSRVELAEQQSLIDGTDETMISAVPKSTQHCLWPIVFMSRARQPLGDVYFPPVELPIGVCFPNNNTKRMNVAARPVPSRSMSAKVGLCVNPMSGRDVRRLAAGQQYDPRSQARHCCPGGRWRDAVGATDIYIAREPFSIASKALEFMDLNARVHVIEYPITNTAKDTEVMIQRFKQAGCHTVVSLGGDGTNRAIVRASSDLDLIPISTGTNNVFPMLVEPTIAGMVAGNARGVMDGVDVGLKQAAKVLHIETPRSKDIGLIDAVLLADDKVGNLLPFEAERLRRMVLTRAEPNAIESPIGGFIDPVYASNAGLQVDVGPGGHVLHAPLSLGCSDTYLLSPLWALGRR